MVQISEVFGVIPSNHEKEKDTERLHLTVNADTVLIEREVSSLLLHATDFGSIEKEQRIRDEYSVLRLTAATHTCFNFNHQKG